MYLSKFRFNEEKEINFTLFLFKCNVFMLGNKLLFECFKGVVSAIKFAMVNDHSDCDSVYDKKACYYEKVCYIYPFFIKKISLM